MSLPTEAKARKDVPIATGVVDYFPLALASVAELSRLGNEQHNPGQPLHWDRSKSQDEADALMRHFVERGTFDTDRIRHSTKVAWRALALLQKEIEASNSSKAAECAPKVEAAPRYGYIRYVGDGPRKGQWWRAYGMGLTDDLAEAKLYAEDYQKRAAQTEFVPQAAAVDEKSCWVLCSQGGHEWTTAGLYTAAEVRSAFKGQTPVRRV